MRHVQVWRGHSHNQTFAAGVALLSDGRHSTHGAVDTLNCAGSFFYTHLASDESGTLSATAAAATIEQDSSELMHNVGVQ